MTLSLAAATGFVDTAAPMTHVVDARDSKTIARASSTTHLPKLTARVGDNDRIFTTQEQNTDHKDEF